MTFLLILTILSCQLLLATTQYTQGRSWGADHKFKEGDAYLEIDKSYLGGNTTTYEFKVAPITKGNRLRVAIQWIRDNGEVYDAIMFICKIRPRYADNNPIIEYYNAGNFMEGLQNSGPETADKSYYDFLVDFMGGENISGLRPEVEVLEQRLDSEDRSASRSLRIKWKVQGHEPLGLNRMWFAYIQYESGVSCDKVDNCFTRDNIIARREGWTYYNVLNFADINLINRDQLMIIYWTFFIFSNFWIIGWPVQIILALYVNFCFTFNILYNWQVTIYANQYNDFQTEAFGFWNWVWESIIFWGLGTTFSTWSMIFATLIPGIGPTYCLLIIVIGLLTMFN